MTLGVRAWAKLVRGAVLCLCLLPFGRAGALGSTTSVIATVQPVRTVIIDSNQIITAIYSNTSVDRVPQVYVGSDAGSPVPLTDTVQRQYVAIMSHVSPTQVGQVYVYHKVAIYSWINLAHRLAASLEVVGPNGPFTTNK